MHEVEPPIEAVHEQIHHAAEHGGERWISGVALSTAVFAAIAAVAIMLSGHYANDATLERIRAADKWSYFNSKGLKKNLEENALNIVEKLGKPVTEKDRERLNRYEAEKEPIKVEAEELEHESKIHFARHVTTTYSIALLQVTITIAAVAALTRRKIVWLFSLAIGVAGVGIFIFALAVEPKIPTKAEEAAQAAAAKHGKAEETPASKETPAAKEPAGEHVTH